MKRLSIIMETVKTTNIISESDVLLLKRRVNNNHNTASDIWDFLDQYESINLTKQHIDKGFGFIYNLYKTPKGRERKNCPFGTYEKKVLECANTLGAHFTFDGFQVDPTSTVYQCHYLPVYTLHSDAGSFSYIYNQKVVLL